MGATLRWKMALYPWPTNKYFAEMTADMRKVFGNVLANIPGLSEEDDGLSNTPHDCRPQKPRPLSRSVYQALLQHVNASAVTPYKAHPSYGQNDTASPAPELYPDAQILLNADFEGVSYGCRGRRNERNSYITFQRTATETPSAGQIVHLFRHMRQVGDSSVTQDFCVVHAFESLSDDHAHNDFWRLWPDIQARLYYERFEREQTGQPITYVVPLEEISSHCATYLYVPEGMEENCILSISVGKVRYRLIAENIRLTLLAAPSS